MLSPAENRLCANDERLTNLPVLLDGDAFGEVLAQACPGRTIESVTLHYVRYKPGTSCLGAYEVRVAGRRVDVYARCHRPDLAVKIDKSSNRKDVAGPLGNGIIIVPRHMLAIYVFPNDHELWALAKLFDPVRADDRRLRIVREPAALWDNSIERLRYKPERRFVGRLGGHEAPQAALKVYRGAHFDAAVLRARAFHSRDALRIPRVLGDAERYCSVASEWIEGRPLDQLVRQSPDAADGLALVGTALAELHRQQPDIPDSITKESHGATVRSAASAVARTLPDLGPRAERLAELVCSRIAGLTWDRQALHGDFSPDQVLVGDGRAGVVDFDRATFGPAAVDLGMFAARLIEMGVDGHIDPDSVQAYIAAFDSAYRQAGAGKPAPEAAVFTAAALMLIAPESFRLRHLRWPEKTSELLACAERIADRGSVAHRSTCRS
jgi:Ser/Thr protein kinase RdoA (MazF antagonist)